MPRQKTKDGINKLFYLDKQDAQLIKNLANAHQMSQSEFVGFIVRNYHLQQDPLKALQDTIKHREALEEQIMELKLKEKQAIKKIESFESTKKLRENKKIDAIEIIKRKILDGADYLEVQEMAKFWAFRLNTDMNELIFIATKQIKENSQNAQLDK